MNNMLPANGDVPMPDSMSALARQSTPEAAGNIVGLAAIRQAIFDCLGSYPAANVLPYAYSFELSSRTGATAAALTANGTGSASIKITADAAFIARYVTGASDGAYLVSPRVDASDRQLVNRAVHSAAWVGTAERPNILPKPLLLPANSTVSFDLTDLSGDTNNVYFTLIGFKIYGYTPNV